MARKKRKQCRRLVLWAVILLGILLVVLKIPGGLRAEKNHYDPSRLRREGSFLRYGESSLTGIDISSHQGEIDWAQVAESGVEFAILRVAYRGYTQGELSIDPRFRENLKQARENGLILGAYVFSQATTAEEAGEEASFALACLDGAALELPVYFDWERVEEGDGRTQSVDPRELTDFAQAFCEEVEAGGCRAGIYFNQTLGYLAYDLKELEAYDLWLAQYSEQPAFLYSFGMWQYSAAGRIPGISEAVDLDLIMERKSE